MLMLLRRRLLLLMISRHMLLHSAPHRIQHTRNLLRGKVNARGYRSRRIKAGDKVDHKLRRIEIDQKRIGIKAAVQFFGQLKRFINFLNRRGPILRWTRAKVLTT